MFQGRKRLTTPLPPAEVNALCRRVQAGDDEAVERLIQGHFGFVAQFASRYRTFGVPVEDLINEGLIGLVEAAKRFDPSRGFRFLTYAVFWVRRSILTAVAKDAGMLGRARSRQSSEAGRTQPRRRPKSLSFNEAGPQHSASLTRGCLSLDDGSEALRGTPLPEVLQDLTQPDPELELIREDSHRILWSALRSLARRERDVIVLRFGMGGGRSHTLREVGGEMGLSRERVRQIETLAMTKLRRMLRHRWAPSRSPIGL